MLILWNREVRARISQKNMRLPQGQRNVTGQEHLSMCRPADGQTGEVGSLGGNLVESNTRKQAPLAAHGHGGDLKSDRASE